MEFHRISPLEMSNIAIEHCHLGYIIGNDMIIYKYPLWKTNKQLWKDPPFFMGNLTISTGPFSIVMLIYQRVASGNDEEFAIKVMAHRKFVSLPIRK